MNWRSAQSLAEAYLLQGDLTQAATAVGRSPDAFREPIPPVILSNLWRAHGRVAFARGEQSRAIALHSRALKQAETAHDSRAIGLAHFCLGQCYRKVGDLSIVREHIAEAAAALHAAGDWRYLAQVHSLSATMLAQAGRYDEAAAALRQAESLATSIQADDVLAMVYGNQANVALIRHRYEQALALAERAVAVHEGIGQGPGLSRSLATLGQICVRLGHLERADTVLHRALDVRCAVQFHETTGAVYDTLAQMSLMRGDYENAAEYLRRAAEAFGAYGRNTSRWYEWSLRVISARLATRRGRPDEALAIADEIARSPAAPPAETIEAELIATEALLSAERIDEAEHRLMQVESRLDPEDDARRLGRVPPAPRQRPGAPVALDRGVSRHRSELERLRAGRRTLSIGRQPARTRPSRRQRRREVHFRPPLSVRRAGLPGARRDPRSGGGARRDGRASGGGDGRVCRLARRRRRCAREAAGGCRGAARPAGAGAGDARCSRPSAPT